MFGVPEITPVALSNESPPNGSPVWDQVMGSVPPLRVTVMVVNTPFSTSHGLGAFDNVSGVRIVRFNDWLAVAPARSVSVTFTANDPVTDGVPLIVPLLEMPRPAGRPVAVQL